MSRAKPNDVHRGGPPQVRPGSLSSVLVVLLTLCSPRLASAERISGSLADSLEALTPSLTSQAHVGIVAVTLDQDETLLSLEPDRRFIPASNVKLFVSGAFLKQFGPDARGATRLDGRGKIRRKHDGREIELKGDLILRASGLPDVYQLLRPGSRGLLDSLGLLLRSAGLTKFEGTLYVDGRIFAPEPYGPGWAVDDLMWSYGGPLNAVLANGNAATLTAASAGGRIALTLEPPETPLRIENRVQPADSGTAALLSIDREPGSNVVRVAGRVPRGTTIRRQLSVPDPDSTAGLVLLGAMRRAGISVKAKVAAVREGMDGTVGAPVPAATGTGTTEFDRVRPNEVSTILRLESPRAAEIVAMVDAYSLNLESEALLRQLDPAPAGKSARSALRRLNAILTEAGVDTADVSLVDGSGLSPLNLTTPRALAQWLAYMARDPALGGPFLEALAVPGGVGTMGRRFQWLEGATDIRAKTGTLTNVSALSGYVKTSDGRRVAFSILSNGNRGSVASARALEEAIVGLIARQRPPQGEPRVPRMIPR